MVLIKKYIVITMTILVILITFSKLLSVATIILIILAFSISLVPLISAIPEKFRAIPIFQNKIVNGLLSLLLAICAFLSSSPQASVRADFEDKEYIRYKGQFVWAVKKPQTKIIGNLDYGTLGEASVNGSRASIDGNNHFSFPVPLRIGENKFKIIFKGKNVKGGLVTEEQEITIVYLTDVMIAASQQEEKNSRQEANRKPVEMASYNCNFNEMTASLTMNCNFTIANNSSSSVKNIKVAVRFFGESGSEIGQPTYQTIYSIVEPKSSRSFNFNLATVLEVDQCKSIRAELVEYE